MLPSSALAAVSIQLLLSMGALSQEHQRSGQQPDNLCGPYWVGILLRQAGVEVTAEQIALAAGSVLPVGEPQTWLPRGAQSRQDYCLPIPITDCMRDAGTSAQGLVQAMTELSNQTYCLIPLQTQWSADRLFGLLNLCQEHPEWNAVLLANLKTGHLWGAGLPVSEAIAYLYGQPITPPVADWDVGHFLVLAGTVTGAVNSLVLVCDTYPRFGWQGYHLQSAEAIANALNRGDGAGGGILVFVAVQHRTQVEQAAIAQGLQVEIWDNGSPIPAL